MSGSDLNLFYAEILFSTTSYTMTAHRIYSSAWCVTLPLSKHDVDLRHDQHGANDCDDCQWAITTIAAVTTPTMAAATMAAISDYNHDQYNPQRRNCDNRPQQQPQRWQGCKTTATTKTSTTMTIPTATTTRGKHKWAVTTRITRFVRPRANSDEPHLLTLTGIARVRLTEPPQVVNDLLPLPRLDVSYPPQDADSPPAADVVQDFKAAAIRLLERFSQDTSQSACKRESWTRIRIAHLVEECESHKAAALAVATATDDDRNGNNDRDDDDDDDDCKRSSTMARELDTVVIV
ncbi:hypothetical protein EDB85DRAFT_2145246 [Lactarius pseudohatsudake]|nr:hypothetical protein EDB85DRAFT_2145246 [Lactarius pseudohatsudake]